MSTKYTQHLSFVTPFRVILLLEAVVALSILFIAFNVDAGNTISVPVGYQPLSISWNISGGYGTSTSCVPTTNVVPLALETAWISGGGATLFGAVSLPAPTATGTYWFRCTHASGVYDEATLMVGGGACTDSGLRIKASSGVQILGKEVGSTTSPLRMAKNGTVIGLKLVATSSPSASAFRVNTSSGVKAVQKCN